MDRLRIKAPAKINLFLKILGKRDDGYHEILSWFQAVSLYDYLTYERIAGDNTKLEIIGAPHLPSDDNNLVKKASRIMFKKFGLEGGLKITLEKNIPIAAGLGGGSADSAATIYAINRLFGLNLTKTEMASIGLETGSDVPFFFSSGQAEIGGRGEKIKEIKLPTDYSIILVTPELELSTAVSYARYKMDLTIPEPDIKLFSCKDFNGLISTLKGIGNDFEEVYKNLYPVLNEIKSSLREIGAELCRLSGSGPTIFGLFENISEREYLQQIGRGNWRINFVKPITFSAWEHEDD